MTSPAPSEPLSTRRARRDLTLASALPYTALLTPNVLHTRADHYVQAFRLSGCSFETTDDRVINDWHERLNLLWRTIADPAVAVWCHLIRHTVEPRIKAAGLSGFAAELALRYESRMAQTRLRTNDWYLALIYKPALTDASAYVPRAWLAQAHIQRESPNTEHLAACERLSDQVLSGLKRYDVERLGTYAYNGVAYSQLLEYLSLLVNGEAVRTPLPGVDTADVLCTSRVLFGADAVEYRMPARRRVGAFLAIKEYPSPTSAGMLNGLLRADYSFVLTQSFTFLPKATAQGLLSRQYNRLQSSGDLAVSQAAALKIAMDQLASNQFVIGDHHLTLQIQSEVQPTGADPSEICAQLEQNVAAARVCLGDAGIVAAREDLALEAAYRAQLPGNFSDRPRRAPITSRNFAGLAAFHNYPSGRATGNHWGDALALLKATSGGPYYLSLHASDPADPDGGSRRDTGHTFVCGPTGSGKTVFLGFCVAMLMRQRVAQVLIDKDHGLEVLVAAMGGEYRTLAAGADTGLNPLRLDGGHADVEFLRRWLAQLAAAGQSEASVRDQADLNEALAGTLALPIGARCLSRLIEFIDPTEPGGLHARMSRWCRSTNGAYAWVFDNGDDRVVGLLQAHPLIGFDVTDFLRLPDVRGPLAYYLFHLIRRIIDGRRLVVWMDEFSTLLDDPAFASFSKDGLKTWRKMNAVAAFATQSPSDVLQSPIARTLIEQTPTKVFFPNPDADRDEHIRGFGLSEREYELVRHQLAPGSRRFLLKQGQSSVVCELDLKGMDLELAVISGRAATARRMRSLRETLGPDPAAWLAQLLEQGEGT